MCELSSLYSQILSPSFSRAVSVIGATAVEDRDIKSLLIDE